MSDELGDRMKEYEAQEAQRRLIPRLPVLARLDGRSFSNFTRGLHRPYDGRLHQLMVATTRHLVEETGALIGYTQSDEISLVLMQGEAHNSQIWFAGKVQKMVSQMAAQASAFFNVHLPGVLPEKVGQLPTFDCRVWNAPNEDEAVNTLLWRELDATKNSVSMAARHYYSHKDMEDKGRADQMEMLHAKGVNWNDYPDWFKRGSYLRRIVVSRKYTGTELAELPARHAARQNPDLEVVRAEIVELDMPPLMRVVNRNDVVFRGASPITASSPNDE